MPDERGLRLLAVTAHPDDETFGCGGVLAKYAGEGVTVSVVCATRGEAGQISDPSLATQENLGEVREKELRRACQALGVRNLEVLGYRDSGMEGTESNHDPRSLLQAERTGLIGKIVAAIRKEKPQVVITFDPSGGYGHPDHITIHEATLKAFFLASDAEQYTAQLTNGLSPFAPRKLYYFVFARSNAIAFRQALEEAGAASDIIEREESMGVPDEEISTMLDVRQYSDIQERAARAHQTQMREDDALDWMPEEVKDRFLSTEHLVRAVPPFVAGDDPVETDLFDGISGP